MVSAARSSAGARSSVRVDFHFPTYGGDGLRPGIDWADAVELSYEDPVTQGPAT